jgi:hypothetical protein
MALKTTQINNPKSANEIINKTILRKLLSLSDQILLKINLGAKSNVNSGRSTTHRSPVPTKSKLPKNLFLL